MNELAFQLMSLQYELAMNMGSTLELEGMLRSVIEALLRRLGGRSAAVFEQRAAGEPQRLAAAMPSDFRASGSLLASVSAAIAGGLAAGPREETLPDGAFRHVLPIPGFGALAFEHQGEALDPRVLRALLPLMARLGRAALACADHARVEAAQRRFSALVETVPEVIFEARIEAPGGLRFEYVSPRARDVLGIEAEALVANPERLAERVRAEDRSALEAALARAASEQAPFEIRVRLDGGAAEAVWVLIAASPQGADRQGGARWSGFIQDVTARELLEESRQALARAQLTSVLMSVGDAVIGTDETGRITHWNRSAERMLGHAESAAIGQPLSIIVPERLKADHARGFAHHLATGESRVIGRPVELPALHLDGREIPVELMLSRAEAGGSVLFFGILRDLSARKQAERERARELADERRFGAALVEVGRVLTASLELPLERVTEVVAGALGTARASVWSLTSSSIVCRDLFEADEGRHSSGMVIEGGSIEPYLAWLREARVIDAPDAGAHPATACFRETYLEPLGIVSRLDAPLRADAVLGVLCVEATERREWRPAEVRFCEEIAGLIGRAMEREARAGADARHEAILSSVGDAVIACDLEQKITLMNPMAEQLTGWSASEALGRSLDQVFRVRGSDTVRPPPMLGPEAPPGGPSFGQVLPSRLLRQDGEAVPIAQSASPVTRDGEVTGLVITFRDIREEEASRKALEHQFRQLRSIGEAIPDLVFTVRTDGTVRYIQRRPSIDLLTPVEEIPGRTLASLFSEPLSRELLGAVSRAVTSHEVQTVEYALELPHGTQRFEARLARMSGDEVTALVRNVTREHERARLLEEERARLQTVLASTAAILYVTRMPGFEIEYISDSATQTLGFLAAEFMRPGFWESALHPDDRARVLSGLAQLLERGVHTHEYRHRHADGTYRWLRDEVRLIRDDDGVPIRAIGASFDITDRKRAESRLSSSLELQRSVSEISTVLLSADLLGIDTLVEAALGRVGRFASADRAYVFRSAGELMFNTHEWSAEGVEPQKERLQGLPVAEFAFFMTPLAQGRPLIIHSVRGLPPEARAEQEVLAAQGIETLLAVPLLYEGELRGFLGIDNPRVEGAAELDDLATPMRVFAEVVAGGLKRAADERELRTLNERIEARVAQQRAMLELSAALPSARSRDELYQMLNRRLGAVLGGDRVSLMTRTPDGRSVRIRLLDIDAGLAPSPGDWYVSERKPDLELEAEALRGHSVWRALEGGELVSTVDTDPSAYTDWIHLRERYGLEHFVIVPLVGPEGVFGCFNVCFARREALTREDSDWVGQVGSLLGAHIAAHEAREALERLNLDLEARVEERTAELRSSEERFTELFRQAPQAMLIVDAEGKVVRTNARAQALFGAGEPLGEGLPLAALIPDAIRSQHAELMRDFFRARENREMAPGRVVTALRLDGTSFSAEIGLVVIHHEGAPFVVAGVTDVTARIAAQAAVVESLREKETMLREIHHRVKNNLQIISSLLMLQSEQMPSSEGRELLTESVLRVRSMALIHQQLYGVDSLEKIDLGDYARSLSESLRSVLMPGARLRVDAEVAEVTINNAVPLGLILNELVTNAFKYGIPKPGTDAAARVGRAGEGCDVRVEIGLEAEALRLAVLDSGPGLPEGFDLERATSLGLHLVRALTRQIRGKLSYDVDRGSRFVVTCPLRGLERERPSP